MDEARAPFLDAASAAVHLLERGELAEHWGDDSVLPRFPVTALAGHLLRGMTTVEHYLDGPEPSEEGISAASYFQAVAGLDRDGRQLRTSNPSGRGDRVGGVRGR